MSASIQNTKASPCLQKLHPKNRATDYNCCLFFCYSLPFLSLTSLFLSPSNSDGVAAFHAFLKTEFSEENLEFWLACEEFKKIRSATKLASRAHRIFEEFICSEAPKEVRAGTCPLGPPGLACSFPTENRGCGGPAGEGLSLEVDWLYLARGGMGWSLGKSGLGAIALRLTDGIGGVGRGWLLSIATLVD